MLKNSGVNRNDRIEALLRRKLALETAINAEKIRQQRKQEKENARLFSITGRAFVRKAELSPQFELMVKQLLQSAELLDTDRLFLSRKGWL